MLSRILFVGTFLLGLVHSLAQLPPNRSTFYDGSAGAQVRFPADVYAPNLSMTVEAWVYRKNADRCETIVAQDYRSSFWFGFCGGTLRFYRNGGNYVDADRNVFSNRWTHVAAVYDAGPGEVRFYIDAVLVATKPRSAAFTAINAPIYLGANPANTLGATFPFHGALDEVRIWSSARTQAQISAGRFQQESSADPDRVACFPAGGDLEIYRGTAATHISGAQKQPFGILPRSLVIPKRPIFDAVDGNVQVPEYAGAEVIPIRYLQNGAEVDAPVFLNAYTTSSATYIYAGVSGLEPGTDMGQDNRAAISFYYGTGDNTAPDNEDRRVSVSYADVPNTYFIGNGSSFVADSSPNAVVAKSFCVGDLSPICIEFRAPIPPASAGQRAMMLHLYWPGSIPILDRNFPSPMDAAAANPTTWAPFSIGQTVGGAETVRINAIVEESLVVGGPTTPVVGATVRLLHGTTLDEIAVETTGTDGMARFAAIVRTNTPLRLELGAPTYWPRVASRAVAGTGVPPSSMSAGSVLWSACTGCDYADVVFTTRAIPAEASTFTGISPTTGHFKRTILRDSPLLELPPSELTLIGENLHLQTEVYLTTCSRAVFSDTSSTPGAATGCDASNFYPVTVLSVGADHRSLRVRLDSATAPVGSNLRIMVRDIPNRDSRRQWSYATGSVQFGEPPYPLVHGFAFRNERDGTQWDEFSGVYEWHAFDCLTPIGPFPPSATSIGCRIPNPIYLTWYSTAYTAWVEAMTGSCLGMAATSVMFARREMDTRSFNSAVHFAAGFPGLGEHGDLPPKPQEHRFEFCNYSHPVNLWAHIHRNQAVQTTSEFLTSILSQMSGTGLDPSRPYSIAGNPTNVLARLRAGLRSHLLCFQNQADVFMSHCVVPFAIMDGKGVGDDGFALIDKPDSTVIHVYDSNDPRATDRFLEVDRTSNNFKYLFGHRRLPDDSLEPVFFTGKGMYIAPITIWQRPRSMPGLDLLARGLGLLVFGSADVLHTDTDGGKWGWEADGTLRDSYLGGRAIAPFTSPAPLPTANTSRGVMFFPPEDRPPASIRINARGSKWTFSASEAGTLAQLEVNGATAGDVDSMNLYLAGGAMRGFQYKPQSAATAFKPTLGLNLGTNPAVVLTWENLSIPAGKSAGFVGRHEKLGAEFVNDTGAPAAPILRILRGDAEGLKTNSFGPFNVPAGAAQLAAIVNSSNANVIRLEVDLDRDGSADSVSYVTPATKIPPPPPELTASLGDKGAIQISWPAQGTAWTLEGIETLDIGSSWKNIAIEPTYHDGMSIVTLASPPEHRFLRLRSN